MEELKKKIQMVLDSSKNEESKVKDIRDLVTHGGLIECPICSHKFYVFHFDWAAITCDGECGQMIDKAWWIIGDHNPNWSFLHQQMLPIKNG